MLSAVEMADAFLFPGRDSMNVFEAVKENVTTRQAAEMYGIRVNRNGMACCPFHDDRNPSLKVDKRFHCFGCQADGDVIDFVARLYGLPGLEAAKKLAADFGISYDSRGRASPKPARRSLSAELRFLQAEKKCFRVLSDYLRLLVRWETAYAEITGGRVEPAVCGSHAETGVCGLSFRHAADRDKGGKSRRYQGAWEGGGAD